MAVSGEILSRHQNAMFVSMTGAGAPEGHIGMHSHIMPRGILSITPRTDWLVMTAGALNDRLQANVRANTEGTHAEMEETTGAQTQHVRAQNRDQSDNQDPVNEDFLSDEDK